MDGQLIPISTRAGTCYGVPTYISFATDEKLGCAVSRAVAGSIGRLAAAGALVARSETVRNAMWRAAKVLIVVRLPRRARSLREPIHVIHG
jgi:hypothetical protein